MSAQFRDQVRRYRQDDLAGWGPKVWGEMSGELWRSRELMWRLFVRDFIAKYKQSILGVSWAVIMPLMVVGVFVFLNRSGILNVGETGVPYPLYALIGLTVWQVFSGGLTACSGAIVAGGSMVSKVNFPKEALVVAAFGQVIIETLVRVVLLAIAFAMYQVSPSWTVVLVPFVLLPMLFLTLGLGLLFSLLNVLTRDVGNILTLGTTFLMFMTPVVYPAPAEGLFADITVYNPLAPLVGAARDMVLTGHLKQPVMYAWASGLSGVFLLFSWRLFHMVEPRMAERL